MRIGIIGSIDYGNHDKIKAFIRRIPKGSVLVTGDAPGVDWTVAYFGRQAGYKVVCHYAGWLDFGGMAGPMRNSMIVNDNIDMLVAFVKDKTCPTKGSRDSINQAKAKGIKVYISNIR